MKVELKQDPRGVVITLESPEEVWIFDDVLADYRGAFTGARNTEFAVRLHDTIIGVFYKDEHDTTTKTAVLGLPVPGVPEADQA